MRPKVLAVVLAWNRRDEVLTTLELLSRSDYPNLEVVVVDNGSTDGTAEAVAARAPRARVVRMPSNVGISARDSWLRETDAPYVAWFDDDSAPEPDAISRMVDLFEADPRVGCVAFGIHGGPFTTEGWRDLPPDEVYGFYACGAGLRVSALLEAGRLDPDFFLYTEEFDLAFRLLDRGYRIVHAPEARAHHRASALHRSAERLRRLTTRNEVWMVLKHVPALRLPRTLVRVLFWNAHRSAHEGSVWYAVRGGAEALRGWRTAWSKRRPVRPEVLRRFDRHFWSFQPAWRTFKEFTRAAASKRLRRLLGLQTEAAGQSEGPRP